MTAGMILAYLGKVILATLLVVLTVVGIAFFYNMTLKDWIDYRRAKKEITAFVKSYKQKCTGNNRFVVTVETLQDSFREYNTSIILKVWLELVSEHVIVTDPEDQVWCIR